MNADAETDVCGGPSPSRRSSHSSLASFTHCFACCDTPFFLLISHKHAVSVYFSSEYFRRGLTKRSQKQTADDLFPITSSSLPPRSVPRSPLSLHILPGFPVISLTVFIFLCASSVPPHTHTPRLFTAPTPSCFSGTAPLFPCFPLASCIFSHLSVLSSHSFAPAPRRPSLTLSFHSLPPSLIHAVLLCLSACLSVSPHKGLSEASSLLIHSLCIASHICRVRQMGRERRRRRRCVRSRRKRTQKRGHEEKKDAVLSPRNRKLCWYIPLACHDLLLLSLSLTICDVQLSL